MREYAVRPPLWVVALFTLARSDPCATCEHGGLCLPKVSDPSVFGCFCPPGWTGPTCGSALDASLDAPAPAQAAPAAVVAPQVSGPTLVRVEKSGGLAPQPLAAVTQRTLRGRDPSWATQVLGREEQVDALIGDLQNDIASLQSPSPSTIVASPPTSLASRKKVGQPIPGGELVLPHLIVSFTLKEDAAHPVDSSNFAAFFPMIVWHSLSDVFISKEDIVITNVDGPARKVTFTVTPTNPLSDVKTVEQKLKKEVEDPSSDLRELLPSLDPSLCVVATEGLSSAIPGGETGEVTMDAADSTIPVPPHAIGNTLNAPASESLASPGAPALGGAAAAADAKAKWNKAMSGPTIPMSTTMRCIIFLTIQYFAVHTLLELANTINKFANDKFTTLSAMLSSCVSTVFFAPMLAILFLGTRMRANQLGVDPQKWAQTAMEVASYAVLAQTVMALLIPFLATLGGSIAGVVSAIKYAVMAAMYGAMCTVVYAVITMEADPVKWAAGPPPVAPAMAATINLTVQFFVVYLVYQIARTCMDLKLQPEAVWEKWEAILDMARLTVNFAPMLSILFIGTRMRALQIDPMAGPGSGVPQPWAQVCFYVTAYCVTGQTLLVVLVPVVGNGTLKKGETEGDVSFEIPNKGLATAVTVLRYVLMIGMYAATVAIVYANLEMKGKDGTAPPLSPAMMNVTMLVTQFFAVFFAQYLIITARDLGGISMPRVLKTVTQTIETVGFAPMLSVLFLGSRMRAMEITNGTGQPQGWVQEAMFLSTFSLMLKLICICILGAIEWAPLAAAMYLVNYAITFMLYSGIVAVCLGTIIMEAGALDGTGGYVYFTL